MSATPLSVTPPSSIEVSIAASFLPEAAEVSANMQQLQDKRSWLLKHIAGSERLAEVRPASRLEVRPRPEMISSGVPEVDAMTGGFPRGCLTEIWGGASSGKTSMMLAAIAAATRNGETCVLIDGSDSFDPASGEAAGMNLQKLLWVRCGEMKWSAALGGEKRPQVERCGWHEKEGGGKSRQRLVGSRQEKHAELWASGFARQKNHESKTKKHSERRLEQVLKATDLILQSGGFGMIVLDLAGIGEKFVRRIPLASWFRFQKAVEHTKSALLVVSEVPCAQTCATLGLKQFSVIRSQRSGKPAHAEVLEDMHLQAEIMRSRLERKPSRSVITEFETQAVRFG